MNILMLSVGAVFGGLYLGLRDLLPYLAAVRSGSITRKGALAVRVRRDEDPDRFARLLANRVRGAALGFGLAILGASVLGLFWLAVRGVPGPYAILTLLIVVGLSGFAAYCLVRGLANGRMFVFWSIVFFGEATRKDSPIWFWSYALANLVLVIVGLLSLLGALAR
jgi:hypothetical protein